ncbi:MAG: SLC13 family permease [Prevotella sp.]|nr:SLC13 family permease [Bacteroidales bacterium]MDY4230042.1 SLC13 family permease [Prevotella sp.]
MTITLIVLALTIALFIWGRVRSDIVALSALVVLIFAGILTPTEALAGFSSPVVIMMTGLFVVGGAILQTGLARAAGNRMMGMAGGNETRAFLLVMLTTSAIGAFVSNTGTVALMMPIIVSMAAQGGFSSSRLLMPLAFAGSLGGMLTLIGTPPNLVVSEELERHGFEGLSFFSFLPVGLIVITIGVLFLLPMSKTLIKKQKGHSRRGDGKSLDDLVEEYQLDDNLYGYRVPARSGITGQKVIDLDLKSRYGVTILEIRNEKLKALGMVRDVSQSIVSGDSVIEGGDILYVVGNREGMRQMAADYGLRREKGVSINFYDIGLAEIVVLPSSKLTNTRIRDSKLRENNRVNILGIRRGEEYIYDDLGDRRLKSGDVLLVQAQWDDLLSLNSENSNWVVLGRPDETIAKATLDYKGSTAAAIMLLMVVLMVTGWTAPATAVMTAALLTIFTGCFRKVEDAYSTINVESVVLIAAMMPMSTALEKTGVSAMVSSSLVSTLGGLGPYALLAGIYFTTSLLTMFISNTATAVLMAPIAMVAAQQTGVSPYAFLMAVTLGASMCFASPFSTPPNALVMKAGHYTFMDYVRVGLPLQIIIGVAMTFVLPAIWPF